MPATTTTTTYSANDLTYGVEIECGIDFNLARAEGLTIGAHGAGALVSALPMFNNKMWRADRDGSIFVTDRTACEFVSPILKGAEGLDNIKEVTDKIKAWGGRVNHTCGLHVHVAFPTDSIDALRRLYRIVGRIEEGIFCSTGSPNRINGGFCKPIKTKARVVNWANAKIGNSQEKYATMYNDRNGLFSDRYHVVNLTNFLGGRAPTVEFRAFSGTLNPEKIAAWVRMCLTIVEMALNGVNAQWDVAERTLLHVPEGGTPETRGQAAVNYLIFYLWRQSHGGRKFGKIDHPRYTQRRAFATLRALATRHDERAGRNPVNTAAIRDDE
jgi:hypothetical protein